MHGKTRLALTKGRLEKDTVQLLEKSGLNTDILKNPKRKLILDIPGYPLEIILLKGSDVATYVEHGVADLGVVGKDILLENPKPVYEVADLGFGACRMAVAGPPAAAENGKKLLRVASKYPWIARNHFEAKGQSVEIIEQQGSVELAPLMGLSDVIVDIVETGNTLKANGLIIMEEILKISARLIVNKVSYKTRRVEMNALIDMMEKQAAEKGDLG
ncbi:MAG: ATP phosphoribosyltransferase [Tindallia sp. MSAO_Bac2]|nr:MAG: ATP phosphoribosyltransferase [Tindallia sp. MSAO_Bac2]